MPNTVLRRFGAVLLATGLGAALSAGPASARPASSVCDKVSAASVSAIVGYTVPAGRVDTLRLKPTKQNDGISGEITICTYGEQTLSGLKKSVTLSTELLSRPLRSGELQKLLAQASTGPTKITFTPYAGLGVSALSFTLAIGPFKTQAIGAFTGNREFGASVFSGLPLSKLGALAKLAATL